VSTNLTISFGGRLRQLREKAGLTQEELAERAGLSGQAIGALERGDRKRPYAHTVHALASGLGLSGIEAEQLLRRSRTRESVIEPIITAPHSAGLSVPPTPLYGRAQAAREIESLLKRSDLRLVTMTGPGGVGKTRLAADVAIASSPQFPDKVVSVSLVPLVDPGLVLATIAQAVGVRETPERSFQDALRVNLANKRMLLVLDNFEHVLDAAPDVADLLASCPDLKLLITSRAPLRLRGEQEFPVQPLQVPADTPPPVTTERAGDFASIVLFVARAREVDPSFSLTDDNVADVAEICRRLDGLPLAIELAAARTRLFTPRALRSRLTNRLSLLTGGARDLPDRQRTMRDAIAWSYGLCSTEEQVLFRRLGVFVGGSTLDAIEAVVGANPVDSGWSLDALTALISNNLIVQERGADGDPRFRMLETIREFALGELDATPEANAVRDAHADWFAGVADLVGQDEYSAKQSARIMAAEPEIDNIRAALDWLIVQQPQGSDRAQLGLRMVGDMVRFWDIRGGLGEERDWLTVALAAAPAVPTPARAFALASLGVTQWFANYLEASSATQAEAIAMSQELDDPLGLIRSTWFMGLVAAKQGDVPRILELAAKCEQIAPRIGQSPWVFTPNYLRGFLALVSGNAAAARELFEVPLPMVHRHGYTWSEAWLNELLGMAAVMEGDFPTALSRFQQGLIGWQKLGDVYGILDTLTAIAIEAIRNGEVESATRLLGVESISRIAIGERTTFKPVDIGAVRERARSAIGDLQFEALFSEGRAMLINDAVTLALSVRSAAAGV
jgi:predicted ATPase/DNA-binding XRE family transcriptional regulator